MGARPALTRVGPHSGPSSRRVGAWRGGSLAVKVDTLPMWLAEAPATRSPAAAGSRWGRRGSRPCSLRGAVVGVRARGATLRGSAEVGPGVLWFSRLMCQLLDRGASQGLVRGCFCPWGPAHATEGNARCPLSWAKAASAASPSSLPQHTHLEVPTVPTRWRCLTPPSGYPGTRRGKPPGPGCAEAHPPGAWEHLISGFWSRQGRFRPLIPGGTRF